jgi:hypothetical protein
MPQRSTVEAIEQHLSDDAAGDESSEFVDLQLDFIEHESRKHSLRAGGRWDRLNDCFVGDAAKSVVFTYHAGQRAAVEWFASWLERWWDHAFNGNRIPTEERIFSLLLSGGVRGGKTYLAVWLAVTYAVMVPGSIVWIVSPSRDAHFGEVEALLAEILPVAWRSKPFLTSPAYSVTLPNGAEIVLKSAHDPGTLKDGDADFVVLNESQLCSEKSWNILRLRIARMGALAVLCANPPDREIGMWVADRIADAEQGEIQAIHFHIDPEDNPFIDHATMHAFAREVDTRTYDLEVRGLILPPDDAVFYNWQRLENEKRQPVNDLERFDCTRRFLNHFEHRELRSCIGLDFQKLPVMAAVEFRWFWNPLVPNEEPEWFEFVHMWAVREWLLPKADEEDLAIALLDSGVDPRQTLLVADASGKFQFAERNKEKIREKQWSGRGSWDVFREYGFTHIVNPDREQERNPDLVERFRTATSRISKAAATQYGQRFLFADPKTCPKTCETFRKYPHRNGVPHRTHRLAHNADAATYPLVRFYKRRRVRREAEDIRIIKSTGESRVTGWAGERFSDSKQRSGY